MARTMHISNPRHSILSAAVALAAAATGCGGAGNSQPPLPLDEANATSVAAEALITTGQTSFTVQLPSGSIPGMAAALRSLDPGAVRRLTALATGPQNADGTMTQPCPLGGSQTITTAGTTVTFTLNNCVQDASTKINGTIRFTVQSSTAGANQISLAASFDFTVAQGVVSFTESGGYSIVIRTAENPSDRTEYELTGDRFSIALSIGGKPRDQVTLSNFDLDLTTQLTTTGQQAEHFTYDIDSSWLRGHVTVMTTQDLKQVLDFIMPRRFPFAGQVLVSGADHTRLQITILGDETFTPPAGQGQIEIQVDPGTGSFGAPIWTSWSELSAMVMTAP
jgi:hypothetical protein